MQASNERRSRRALPGLLAAIALVAAGCGDGKEGSFGSDAISRVEVATQGGDFQQATDATTSPDGETVYFTATGSTGPGVFRVAAGGRTATPIATGAPFQAPVGVAVSTDGARLFVADPEARTVAGQRGAVFTVPVAGGASTVVSGTEGHASRGLEVARDGGADVVYFTGKAPSDGVPGVFKVPAGGGKAATVARGTPFADLDALTVTKASVVYVTDRGHNAGEGAVYRLSGAATEKVAPFRPPQFAGITLTLDESTVFVSALSDKGTDQVLVIEAATRRTGVFDKTIRVNRQGGGLHRAHNVEVFAWADLAAGPDRRSRVYLLRP